MKPGNLHCKVPNPAGRPRDEDKKRSADTGRFFDIWDRQNECGFDRKGIGAGKIDNEM